MFENFFYKCNSDVIREIVHGDHWDTFSAFLIFINPIRVNRAVPSGQRAAILWNPRVDRELTRLLFLDEYEHLRG